MNILRRGEKKVEYIELIYDLIFVYMIGKNNSILHHVEDGFIPAESFFVYVMCTLAIIQIWTLTTFYINVFGRNSARDFIFLFINMYLMYFIGESTRQDWEAFQTQYHVAWGLILVNIGIQYLVEIRNHKSDVWNREFIKRMSLSIFIMSGCVFVAAVPNQTLGPVMSALGIAVDSFWYP